MKKKNLQFILMFSGTFLLVGIIMLVVGILVLSSSLRFRERAEEVAAVISEISSYRDSDGDLHHRVLVSYTYGGRFYEDMELNFYSSGMYEGKEIVLLCDPDDPGRIETEGGMLLFSFIFIGMGGLFLVIGAVPVILAQRSASRRKKLLRSGRKLYAVIEEIAQNLSFRANGWHPYVIYCTYRDDSKDITYRFKSGNLWTNPNPALRPGDMIPVYVDENNFQYYHVDAESGLESRIVDYT